MDIRRESVPFSEACASSEGTTSKLKANASKGSVRADAHLGGVWHAHHSGESNWYVNGYGLRTWGLAIQRFQGLAKKYQHGASNVKLPKDKAIRGRKWEDRSSEAAMESCSVARAGP